jgi:hypothetical protein
LTKVLYNSRGDPALVFFRVMQRDKDGNNIYREGAKNAKDVKSKVDFASKQEL